MLALFSSKKGDLEFIEAIMVVVVIVVLLVIGLAIYYNVSIGSMRETGQRISEVEATVLVNVIDSLPETQCSMKGSPKDCVDVVKLQAFRKVVDSNKAFYVENYGFKVIRFEQLFPVPTKLSQNANKSGECEVDAFNHIDYPETCGNWTVYHHPKPNYTNKNILKTPVSLYHPMSKRYAVGVLFVEVYS
ncbi:MAG: hypothetical protein ABIH63_00795 [archaeon]